MATTSIKKQCLSREKQQIISSLEQIGRILLPIELKSLLSGLDLNREKSCRLLLLAALLDQQAESPTARKTALEIYRLFGNDLFFNPQKVLTAMNQLIPIEGEYKISPAIGRVLPRFGWIVLRVGGFLIYEMTLHERNLSEELGKSKMPSNAVELLQSDPVLRSILRDKAARLYLSWVGHPDLGIDVSDGRWKRSSFAMPVNGHVGKIFSRSGIMDQVIHEGGSTKRANIIVASKMRPLIQEVANKFSNDPAIVDHGAFQIGFNCCPDNLENISCDSCVKSNSCQIKTRINCPGYCLLSPCCKRNLEWRAY